MSTIDWIFILIEAGLVVLAVATVLDLEKKRPTEQINPATEEDTVTV